MKVLLSPLSLVIWGYEQLQEQFVPEVERKLEGVPEDRRIEPPLLISGPTVEALRFAGGTPELRELFANLLATAIDAETARDAHPSFVDTIRQLSPDEARILKYMRSEGYEPIVNLERKTKGAISTKNMVRYFSLLGRNAGLEHGELSAQYIDNLCRLGLCEVPPGTHISIEAAYEPVEEHPDVVSFVAQMNATENYEAQIERLLLRLTSLGKQFVVACVQSRDAGAYPPKIE